MHADGTITARIRSTVELAAAAQVLDDLRRGGLRRQGRHPPLNPTSAAGDRTIQRILGRPDLRRTGLAGCRLSRGWSPSRKRRLSDLLARNRRTGLPDPATGLRSP